MSVRLLVKQRSAEGGAEKATEVLLDDDVIHLGRDTSCHVVLAEQAVSRTHARISRDGTLFFVEDMGSAYGTQINGRRLPKGEKRLLRNGDVIAIAQFDVTFDRVVGDAAKAGDHAGTVAVARQVVKDVMRGLSSGGEGPYFRVMNGGQEGQRIEIQDAQELIIGRDDTAHIVLRDDLVSRRHVKIRRDWSGTHVEDLGSRNGIRINGRRIARKTLKDRDELEVGNTRLLYLDPSEVREGPVVLAEDEEDKTAYEPADPPNPNEANGTGEPSDSDSSAADSGYEADDEVESAGQPEEMPEPPSPDPDEEFSAVEPSMAHGGLRDKTNLIALGIVGIFALGILGVVIAILVGA